MISFFNKKKHLLCQNIVFLQIHTYSNRGEIEFELNCVLFSSVFKKTRIIETKLIHVGLQNIYNKKRLLQSWTNIISIVI